MVALFEGPHHCSKTVGDVDPGGVANLSWVGWGGLSVRRDLNILLTMILLQVSKWLSVKSVFMYVCTQAISHLSFWDDRDSVFKNSKDGLFKAM